MSEIERALKRARQFLFSYGYENPAGMKSDLEAEAAERRIVALSHMLAAYEQHRGKQEPVACRYRFRDDEPWRYAERDPRAGHDSDSRVIFENLYASPQPADVGALISAAIAETREEIDRDVYAAGWHARSRYSQNAGNMALEDAWRGYAYLRATGKESKR